METVLWQVTMSLDGYIADPDDAMDWVFKYSEPNVTSTRSFRRTA